MDKTQILDEILRTAKEDGEVPFGVQRVRRGASLLRYPLITRVIAMSVLALAGCATACLNERMPSWTGHHYSDLSAVGVRVPAHHERSDRSIVDAGISAT